jgi:DNA-binding NtrC family response regulator
MKNILLSWLGHADLKAMAQDSTDDIKTAVEKVVRSVDSKVSIGLGPIKTLTSQIQFDSIYLLTNYQTKLNKAFAAWLGCNPTIIEIELKNPTDYQEVYSVADANLKSIYEKEGREQSFNILLSPGTPAMTAIWVLLGKTKYPAQFYQTFDGKHWKTDIPFDITVDVIPELLHDTDFYLQQFASKTPQEIKGFENIIGKSQAIRIAVGRAQKAALRNVPVLITGESGTGKELFARAIHKASSRRDKPIIVINCAAIPKELLETELFGHIKGAFTGASNNKAGAFELAHGGTLFLDEIGECDPAIQAKLLRALQPISGENSSLREIQPVGAVETKKVDVRIIAATNKDLIDMVDKGSFREDLYYRLAVITIGLPPLRERKSDIPEIAENLLTQINEDFSRQEPNYKHKYFSAATNKFVKQHEWRGNVRQLYNVILQAAVMSDTEEIKVIDIKAALNETIGSRKQQNPLDLTLGEAFSLDEQLDLLQVYYIKKALEQAHGVKSEAARLLGLRNYQTLDAKMKKLKIEIEK